jgi:hypothetical protein
MSDEFKLGVRGKNYLLSSFAPLVLTSRLCVKPFSQRRKEEERKAQRKLKGSGG